MEMSKVIWLPIIGALLLTIQEWVEIMHGIKWNTDKCTFGWNNHIGFDDNPSNWFGWQLRSRLLSDKLFQLPLESVIAATRENYCTDLCDWSRVYVEVGVELIIEQKAILDIFFAIDHILGLQWYMKLRKLANGASK